MAIQLEKSFGSYHTEDFRTKESARLYIMLKFNHGDLCIANHCFFEICALCLSSTMESARLYMWQNPMGARRWCEGPSGGRL